MNLPDILIKINNRLKEHNAKGIVVGGAVRDYLLNLPIKDIDIEVFNIKSYEKLALILSSFGKTSLVGKKFGVIKLKVDNLEYDFTLPRLEQKVAKGHKGFIVDYKKDLTFKKAAKRRDFTINAIGYDISTTSFLDPYSGIKDLKQKILRVVDKNSFIQDPLRVYRAIQFVARFELELDKESFNLCKLMVKKGNLEELPKERIFEEFKKLLLKAKKPSIGLELLKELGIIKKYFPTLNAIIGVIQDPIYHSEGDVWRHTLMVVDEMAKLRSGNEKKDLIRMFAALTHDFGKATTTKIIDSKIRALNHDIEGVEPTIKFLEQLTNDKKLIDEVSKFTKYHLRVMQLYKNKAKLGAIRRLATKIDLKELEILARADYFGRISKDKSSSFKAGEWFLDKAKKAGVLEKKLEPLILGRDLIELGLMPCAEFKKILKKAYEAQLDEAFNTKEEGKKWLKEKILS